MSYSSGEHLPCDGLPKIYEPEIYLKIFCFLQLQMLAHAFISYDFGVNIRVGLGIGLKLELG